MEAAFVHGGVSGTPKPELPSLGHALRSAAGALSALDAVELAVRTLEDDPKLNAGTGSVLNLNGELELDAGIADGSTGRCAGVANVRVRNPISLARRVMETTPHVLLTGAGAAAFGHDMEAIDATAEQLERWRRAHAGGALVAEAFGSPEHVDTVGAVAIDTEGRLAAASSTGGVFGKLPGRVGDAPVFGAGMFASKRVAVVGTGVGELFLQTLAAVRVALKITQEGLEPQRACEEVIDFLGGKAKTSAGLLALDSQGRVGAAYRGGSWAVEGPDGLLEPARLD